METAIVTTKRETGQAIALRPSDNSEVAEVQRLGGLFAASGYFSDVRDMAQAAVKVMAGRELGVPPVASMMGINIIKGKVAMGAHLIASRVKAHGYDFKIKRLDKTGCALEFLGKLDASGAREVLGESSFTEDDAKTAQAFSEMYKKYPRNMYYSRAVSNGAKWFCPEVFSGTPVYTPEELGEEVDAEGEIVKKPETTEQVAARRISEERAKARKTAESQRPNLAPQPANEQAPAPTPTVPSEPYQATDEDLPPELGGTWTDPDPRPSAERRIAKPEQVKVTREDFRKLRTEFVSFGAAGAAEFDRIVTAHGAEKGALHPPTTKAAQQAYVELADSLRQIKSLREEVPEVEEEVTQEVA